MSITLLQHTGNGTSGGTSIGATFGSACTPHSLIVVTLNSGNGTGLTLGASDPTNGAYTVLGNGDLPIDGDGVGVLAFLNNASSSALTITGTSSGSGGGLRMTIAEFGGFGTGGATLDKTATQGYSASTTTPVSGSTGTLTQAVELLFAAALCESQAPGFTAGSGYTLISNGVEGGSAVKTGTEYQVTAATTGQTAGFTMSSADEVRTFLFSFMPASSGTSENLTAQTITSSEGTPTGAVTYGLTGQTATFTEGTITASTGGNVTLSLTGQTATLTEGTVTRGIGYSLNDGVPLTGQTATFAEGSAASAVTYGLTGQTATFAEGTLLRAAGYSVTGQSSTFTEGVITGAGALSLVGQTASFTEGSISVSVGGNVTVALTGQTITSSEGSILGSSTYSVTGQTSTFTEGLLNPALLYALSGQSVLSFPGTVTPSGGTSLGPAAFFMVGFICNVGTLTVKDQY